MQIPEVNENAIIAQEYKNLLRNSYQSLTSEDKKLIRLAFDTAVDAHKDQRRKSGEPYIMHPIAVAQIVADQIGLGATSIAAALLHDVVEDTSLTLDDIALMFWDTVAKIVDGLTKISKLSKDKRVSIQAENFKKMLLTMNEDVRVILIKIADRLHNMMTLTAMPEEKQVRIASETLYIYAPLAHRIGMFNIKTQLEDLALKYTEPEVYNDIDLKIKESEEELQTYIKNFTKQLQKHLSKERINFKTEGLFKSIFSIRRKMQIKNRKFDEVFDRFAVRIIYKSTPKQ